MAKHAIWRDVSKTSATGLYLPEYRLKTPNGDAVLKLANSAVFNADDPAQHIFHLRCSSVGIINESTGERDIEKAKKAAENMLRKRMRETIAAYQEDLEALDNIISRERKATELPKETEQTPSPAPSALEPLAAPTSKANTEGETRKRRGHAAEASADKATKKTAPKKVAEKTNAESNTKPAAKRRGRRTEAG